MNNALLKTSCPFCLAGILTAALTPIGCAVSRPPAVNAGAPAPAVHLVKKEGGFQLLRNGQPYFIKGAGGDGAKPALKAAGANSWRTWGADDLDGQLAEAQTLGMTVTAGFWLGHKEHGFDYGSAAAVAAQKEAARKAILRCRNSPALLMWALGNEMETGQEDNAALWDAVEDIAKMAHQLDPNHPTMTVIAELGSDKVKQINAHCPDIDIIGINTYAGGPSIGVRYKAAGGVKPYVITEFGPPGTWESAKNAWGMVPELTSTEKAACYRETYEKSVLTQPLCLGSYAFTWGNKQEATATWFGLLLPEGSKLGAVDALTQLWSGHKAANLSPVIRSLKSGGPAQGAPGATVKAALEAMDPEGDSLAVTWVLRAESTSFSTGGGAEAVPPTFPEAVVASSRTAATIKMPLYTGGYRLYAYLRDGHGGAAVGNIPLEVQGGTPFHASAGRKAVLPLILLGDGTETPFTPSGYMGNARAIKMNLQSTASPHSGRTCLRAEYAASDQWGGVVWQNPENNWGETAGGWDLSGAKALTFWARGGKGGEAVSFSFGLVGKDKPYSDTGAGKTDRVVLNKEWTQYRMDLKGIDLSRIVTGFCWVTAATGKPVTFYLDDIRYE